MLSSRLCIDAKSTFNALALHAVERFVLSSEACARKNSKTSEFSGHYSTHSIALSDRGGR